MEEEIKDKTKQFNVDEELPRFDAVKLVKKELFVTPTIVKIVEPKLNKFGKPSLVIEGPNDDYSGQINITNESWNSLLKTLGNKMSDWVDAELKITALKFQGNEKANEGYTLKIEIL